MSRKWRSTLRVGARILLGVVFLYSGIVKIMDPIGFAGNVHAYGILPYFGNYLTAAILPWLEATCGLLLLSGYRVKPATFLILCMNVIFMAALLSAIVRGLDIDCGCFRPGGAKTSPWIALLRDAAFFAAALALFTFKEKVPCKRGPAGK